MQRKAIAALMISLLLLSACGHGAGEQTFEAFRDTLTGKLVTVTAQVRVQRGDTVTDYTLTCQELPDGYDLTVTVPEQAAGVTAHLRDGASTLAFDDIILPAGDLNGAGLTPLTVLPYVVQAIRSGYVDLGCRSCSSSRTIIPPCVCIWTARYRSARSCRSMTRSVCAAPWKTGIWNKEV